MLKLLLPLVLILTPPILNAEPSKLLSGPEIWETIFVPEIHDKFYREVPSTTRFEQIVKGLDGKVKLDHGATRAMNKQVFDLTIRIAKAFGLQIQGHYFFPDKKLHSVAMQVPDSEGFKWFSTLVEYEKFTPSVASLIEDDFKRAEYKLTLKGETLLHQLETQGLITEFEARALVHEVVYGFFKRNGMPLKQSTYDAVAAESQEAANALLLGPDFNHIAYSLNDIAIKDWYGLEVIEILTAKLKERGFEMIPSIQGAPGSKLRQTSIKAEKAVFMVESEKNGLDQIRVPSKFLEFVQRGPDEEIVFDGNRVKLFQGFLESNAAKIFDSTKSSSES